MLKKTYLLFVGTVILLVINISSAKSAVHFPEYNSLENITLSNDSLDRPFKEEFLFLVVTEEIVNLSHATLTLPNPIKNVLIVKLEEAWTGEISIKLLDKEGEIVKWTTIDKSTPFDQLIMKVDDLPKGAYILQIKKNNQIALKRIVKT